MEVTYVIPMMFQYPFKGTKCNSLKTLAQILVSERLMNFSIFIS